MRRLFFTLRLGQQELFGEQVIDQLGCQNDDADHHKDHQHTHAHITQAVHKTHQIKVKIHKFTPFEKN